MTAEFVRVGDKIINLERVCEMRRYGDCLLFWYTDEDEASEICGEEARALWTYLTKTRPGMVTVIGEEP